LLFCARPSMGSGWHRLLRSRPRHACQRRKRASGDSLEFGDRPMHPRSFFRDPQEGSSKMSRCEAHAGGSTEAYVNTPQGETSASNKADGRFSTAFPRGGCHSGAQRDYATSLPQPSLGPAKLMANFRNLYSDFAPPGWFQTFGVHQEAWRK